MHDRNGTPIKAGDIVLIEAKIAEVYACEDYCNARIAIGFDKEHAPDNVTSFVTINTRQLLLSKKSND